MSKLSDLVLRFLHRKLADSKNTPTQYTASAGTVRAVVCAALTEAADYWNGALLRWDSGPNAGLWSSVKDFDDVADTLTLDEDLPAAVANTHLFTLFTGGKYVSSQRIPGLTCSSPVTVTGFSVSYAAMRNGAGTGTLKFKFNGGANQGVTWTPPGGVEGLAVDISALALGASVPVFGSASDAFVLLTRTASALPGADTQDDLLLAIPDGAFLAMFDGDESLAGKSVYRAVGMENTADSPIYAVRAFCVPPWSGAVATTIAAGGAIGTGAGVLLATNLGNWGVSGWVYNATKNDVRYFYDRSGNSCKVADPAGGLRDFVAVAWNEGDSIEPYPWFDLGLQAPGVGNAFSDTSSESSAPVGVAFSCPRDEASALLIGDMAAGALYVIWERYVLPPNTQPIDNELPTLRLLAEVTQ